MGSIISFPVLCILNAVVCRTSLEVSRNGIYVPIDLRKSRKFKEIPMKSAPMRINGDDAALRLRQCGYEAWKLISSVCGFLPSVGKTFYTTEFVQINSVNFKYVPPYKVDGRTLRFRRVKFINMGLLYGKVRSASSGADRTPLIDSNGTLGAKMRDLLSAAPSYAIPRLSARFVSLNKKTLLTCRLPWFLPEKIGGVGLVGLPCKEDIDYAKWAIISLPKLPCSLRPVALSDPAAWQMRLLSLKFIDSLRCPVRLLDETEAKLQSKALDWIGSMQLFDLRNRNDPSRLYKAASQVHSSRRGVRLNERFIGKAKRRLASGEYLVNYWPSVQMDPTAIVNIARTLELPSRDYAIFLGSDIPFPVSQFYLESRKCDFTYLSSGDEIRCRKEACDGSADEHFPLDDIHLDVLHGLKPFRNIVPVGEQISFVSAVLD